MHISDQALAWPDVVVPNLHTLYVGQPFRFKNEHFPRLHALSIYPQRSLNNVRQALELLLEELNLLNVPTDEEIFRLVEPVGLRRLGLIGGRTLTSLHTDLSLDAPEMGIWTRHRRASSDWLRSQP